MILAGRTVSRLEEVAPSVRATGNAQVEISTEREAIREADAIIPVTGALETVIDSRHLKPGAIVCDVARPRDVSRRGARERDDVLVIDGGMAELPGAEPDSHFNFGLPPGMGFACLAETVLLALEGRHQSYSLDREVKIERMEEMPGLDRNHSFGLFGFRRFQRPLTDAEIEAIKKRAKEA